MPLNFPDFLTHANPAFPIAKDTDLQGGLSVVNDIEERDAIPLAKRKHGMVVGCVDNGRWVFRFYGGQYLTDGSWSNKSNWIGLEAALEEEGDPNRPGVVPTQVTLTGIAGYGTASLPRIADIHGRAAWDNGTWRLKFYKPPGDVGRWILENDVLWGASVISEAWLPIGLDWSAASFYQGPGIGGGLPVIAIAPGDPAAVIQASFVGQYYLDVLNGVWYRWTGSVWESTAPFVFSPTQPAPSNKFWYEPVANVLYLWSPDEDDWVPINGGSAGATVTVSDTEPADKTKPWFDTVNAALSIWVPAVSAWVAVGGAGGASSSAGVTVSDTEPVDKTKPWFDSSVGTLSVWLAAVNAWVAVGGGGANGKDLTSVAAVVDIASTSYILTTANIDKYNRFTSGAAPKTLTIPLLSGTFTPVVGNIVTVRNVGAGDLTIAPVGLGVRINAFGGSSLVAPNTTAQLMYVGIEGTDQVWDLL